MYILNKRIKLKDLINVENDVYFDDIVKAWWILSKDYWF